jgi:hypothetical protein
VVDGPVRLPAVTAGRVALNGTSSAGTSTRCCVVTDTGVVEPEAAVDLVLAALLR